jgi:hypothetical protein
MVGLAKYRVLLRKKAHILRAFFWLIVQKEGNTPALFPTGSRVRELQEHG